MENEWFTVPEAEITLGLDDPENELSLERHYGWDNEKPSRTVHVKAFSAKGRPITNGDYAEYLEKTGTTSIPASWCETPYITGKDTDPNKRDSVVNGSDAQFAGVTIGKYVRTVYGAVPLRYALEWPVVASFDELAGCARWMGGRIPTMEEVRSIYNYVEDTKSKEVEQALGKTIPAVNRYLLLIVLLEIC